MSSCKCLHAYVTTTYCHYCDYIGLIDHQATQTNHEGVHKRVAFNLQVAQVASLFDWRWNPTSEHLAMDRIHRAHSNAFAYLEAGSDVTFVAARRR